MDVDQGIELRKWGLPEMLAWWTNDGMEKSMVQQYSLTELAIFVLKPRYCP